MGAPALSIDDLSDADRARLERAHRDLDTAVAAYERFVASPLRVGEPLVVAGAAERGAAQQAVEAAEEALWSLREELLGWSRPSWVPSATLTSDWFSPEDAIYDDDPGT